MFSEVFPCINPMHFTAWGINVERRGSSLYAEGSPGSLSFPSFGLRMSVFAFSKE